jgi:outer membrane lipoprotein-sorting protein
MVLRSALALPLMVCLTAGIAPAQSNAELLAKLDQSARTFKGALATIHSITHNQGVPEDDVQDGNFLMRRVGSGAQMRIDFKPPNEYSVLVSSDSAEIYHPKMNQTDVYDIRQYKDFAQKLLLLGFGMPGKELETNYQIRTTKPAQMDGQATTYLELIPKSPEVRKQIARIEIWLSDSTRCPVRQTLHMIDGGFRTAQYSNLQVNPKFPGGAFDLPKSAKRVKAN